MTKMLRVLLAICGCVACNSTVFAGGPFGIIRVGKWQGAAYTTDKGAFSHCTAAAKFDSGLAIIIAQNANRSWIIGIADPAWPFHDRESVTLVLTFDGQAQFNVSGAASPEKAVVGILPVQAVNAFRKSHQLVVTATKQTRQFDLAAAGNVIPAIEYCVDKINTNGIASAGDFSNPKSSNAQAKPPRQKPRPNPKMRLRKSPPIPENWSTSQAAASSSAKTRTSSPTITSLATASAIFTAISPAKPR
jgi:hypothetical protein